MIFIFIFIGVVARFLPHLPNMTPIGAIALFGGRYLPKRLAIVLPLVAMVISDLYLGFHKTMPYVYGSFILTSLIGMWLRHHTSSYHVVLATLISSTLFFLITNFGVWAHTPLYSKTITGLMESYVMGLPFFRNTLIGDLFYSTVFFGGYELVVLFKRNYAEATEKLIS